MIRVMGRDSVVSIGDTEALLEVVSSCDRRVFVGSVAAGDQSIVIRLEEESQRLTGAGVSSRGQQNSVELRERETYNISIIFMESMNLNCTEYIQYTSYGIILI